MWGKSQRHNHKSVSSKSLELNHRPFSQIVLLGGLVVIVCVVVAAAHWPALSARALSIDDQQYIRDNYLVRNPSWASVRRFLTEVLEPSTVEGYYQPLTMLSLMLDCGMGGEPGNLRPFHITSLCLHVINTALVIALLYMLFGEVWPAVMAGLLFGIHPLTAGRIAWVTERKTLLASFFALWSMVIYVRYTYKSNWKLYVVCVLMYVLALMAKPSAMALPVLFLLLDFWPLRRPAKRALIEKIPLFLIALVFAIITVISQGRAAEIGMPTVYSPMRIILILCHNIIFYLCKIFWPLNLSVFYPFPQPLSVSNPMVLAGVIGTSVLIPMLVLSCRWTRALLTGWLIFFVAIFPAMGVIGFTDTIVANRFVYLPSIGFLLILSWLFGRLWGSTEVSGRLSMRRIAIVVAVVILAAFEIISTRSYLVHWRDSESHHRYICKLAPNSAKIHDFVGVSLAKQGKDKEATSHFTKAVCLAPNYHRSHINLGIMLAKRGDLVEAITHFVKAIQLNPSNDKAHHNLGQAFFTKGEISGAIKHYRESLRLKPNNPGSLTGLSWILATSEKSEFRNGTEAVRLAKRACELTNYRNPETLNALAAAYAETGRFTEAVEIAQKAIELCVSSGNEGRAKNIAGLQQLYKAGQPYRAN